MPIREGARIFGGRYEVVREIESGGMGTVFEALDHNFEPPRVVAVKTIKTHGIGPDELPEFLRLFNAEAGAAGQLIHDGIVSVFDHDPYADEPYIVMPYIEGGTLKKVLKERRARREGPLDPADVAELGIQVADALHYAHKRIQAHRDIKPGNIFRDESGRYKVGDFGIARVRKPGGATRTRRNDVVGTPEYMAPEQWYAPADVDGQADLFALCIVLFEALTGDTPFVPPKDSAVDPDDPDVRAKVESHFRDQKVKFGRAIPLELTQIVGKGLEIVPRDRFKDCGELADALRRFQRKTRAVPERASEPRSWFRVALLVGALLVTAGIVVVIWPYLSPRPEDDLSRAHDAAKEAQADVMAADTWSVAETKRADAVRLESRPLREEAIALYAAAIKESLGLAADQAKGARETATAGRAPDYAPDDFAKAEKARARGMELQASEPAQAIRQLIEAKNSYVKAAEAGSAKWTQSLRERQTRTRAELDKIVALLPVAERPSDLAGAYADAERAVAYGNLAEAERLVAALERRAGRFSEMAQTIILATARRSAEEARTAALGAQRKFEQSRSVYPIGVEVLAQDIRAAGDLLASAQMQYNDGEANREGLEKSTELFGAAAQRFEDVVGRLATAESTDLEQRAAIAVKDAAAARTGAEGDGVDDGIAEFARARRDLEQAQSLIKRDPRVALQLAQQATAEFAASQKVGEIVRAIHDAETVQAEARQLGADTNEASKATYARALQALDRAKAQMRSDPAAATQAAARAKVDLTASIEATKMAALTAAAVQAIETARGAQRAAEQGGAATLARDDYAAAEKLLAETEQLKARDPNAARRQAETARDAFAKVLSIARAQVAAQAIADAEATEQRGREVGGEKVEKIDRYQAGIRKLAKAKELLRSDAEAAQAQAIAARADFDAVPGIVDREHQIGVAREAIATAERTGKIASDKKLDIRDGTRLLAEAVRQRDSDPAAAQRSAEEAEKAFVAAVETAELQANVRLAEQAVAAAVAKQREVEQASGASLPEYRDGIAQLTDAQRLLSKEPKTAIEHAEHAQDRFSAAVAIALRGQNERVAAEALKIAEDAQRASEKVNAPSLAADDYEHGMAQLAAATDALAQDPLAAREKAQQAKASFVRAATRAESAAKAKQIEVADAAIGKAQRAQQEMKGLGAESKAGVQALLQATKLRDSDPVQGQRLAQEAEQAFSAAAASLRQAQARRLAQDAVTRAQKARQVAQQNTATGEERFREGDQLLTQANAAIESDPASAEQKASAAEAAYSRAVAQVQHNQKVQAASKDLDVARQVLHDAETAGVSAQDLTSASEDFRQAESLLDSDPGKAAALAQHASTAARDVIRSTRKSQTRELLAQAEKSRATAQQRRANVLAKNSFDDGEKLLRAATAAGEQDWSVAQDSARRAVAAFDESVRAVGDLSRQAGERLAQAKAKQDEAKAAKADLWPSARKAFSEAEQLVRQAQTSSTQGALNETIASAQKADAAYSEATRFARDEAVKNPSWMETRDRALETIKEADAAREAAKKSGAANPQLTKASSRYQEAERGLSAARENADLEPGKALAAAQSASAGFADAEKLVAAALADLEQKAEQARGQALAAQKKADAVPGAAQFASYKNAQKALGDGDARRSAKTSEASLGAAQAYDGARKLFERALVVAKGPVQSVSPAADSVVEVNTGGRAGSGARFSVELAYPEAKVGWLLDGQRAPGSAGDRDWEYRPGFDDPEQDHIVKVTVEGEEGKTVTKQWTARVVAANEPPKITAISPNVAAVPAGKGITFTGTVEDPDSDRGDRVTCKWNVNGQPRAEGQCGFQWQPDAPGTYKIELVATDRRGATTRKERQIRSLPPADQLVDEWLADECRRIEKNYEEKLGDKVKCRWKGREIAGELPEVTVSYVRIDEFLKSGDTKELPKKVALRCTEGNCVPQ